jgi:RNA polymerase sigma-70 factor (ECF subfamily)
MTAVSSPKDVTQKEDHIQGNSLEFHALYNQIFPVIFRVACNICRNAEAAEDICHDSFIRYIEKKPFIPNKDETKYWLIRVTKNAALNYIKHKKVENKVLSRLWHEEKRTIKTGEVLLLQQESCQEIKRAFDELPVSHYEMLMLKDCEFNYQEIGRIIGISEGAVKIRMFRARQRLLVILERHSFSDFFTDNNHG